MIDSVEVESAIKLPYFIPAQISLDFRMKNSIDNLHLVP